MKKVISFCVMLLLLFNTVAFAQESDQGKAVFELQSLGILRADETGDLRLDSPMTRAEFAAVVVRVLDMELVADSVKEERIYTDVPADAWFTPYVNLLYHFNIMHGDGKGMFNPDAQITQNEVVKVLLCCVGYGNIAYEQGGYPDGYVMMASTLGLYKNVNASASNGAMLRRDIAQMVYNTLDVKVMTCSFSVNGKMAYEVSEDETLRRHMSDTINGKGTVTANYSSYLNSPVSELKWDEVVIDDQIYKVGSTNAAEFLGRKVEYYAKWDEDLEETTLVSIRTDKSVVEVSVEAEDVLELTQDKLIYEEEGRRVTENIAKDAAILKNGYLLLDATETLTLNDGYLVAIDNDGGGFDVVFIYDYVNGKVELVVDNAIYFEEVIEGNVKFLELDPQDTDVKFTIKNAAGEEMKTEEIQPDDIVSVFRSRDGSVLDLVVNRQTAQGAVEEVEENYVTIGGETYRYDSAITFKPGDEMLVYIDYRGKIAYSERKTMGQASYGYVIEYSSENFNSYVKMILPGDFKEEMVSNMDEENPIETAVLRGKNTGVQVYELASNVSVFDQDGNKLGMGAADLGVFFGSAHSGTLVNNRVVKFKLDSQNRIKTLELPQRIYDPVIGTDARKTYNSYEKVFAKSGNTPFGANENTKVLCIPDKEGIRVEDDYYVTVDLENGSTYTVSGFDMDEKSEIANLIVITTTMDSSTSGVIDDKSPFGVIDKVTVVQRSSDSDPVYEVYLYAEGTRQKRQVADIDEVKQSARQLKRGDVIYFNDDADGNINKIELLESLKDMDNVYSEGSSSNEQRLFGRVIK